MKSVLLLLFIFPLFSIGQETWTVSYNGKLKFKAAEESEKQNAFALTTKDLKSKKGLTIIFNDPNPIKDWKREITVVDTEDNEFMKVENNTLNISPAKLRSIFAKSRVIKIYTMALPKDPNLVAVVRVRRVHLCTLALGSL
jgi:predicted DNA-binding ArsR family transcriptional regulator